MSIAAHTDRRRATTRRVLDGLIVLAVALAITVVVIDHVGATEPAICGEASWYGPESGSRTATGDHFDGSSLTAAMPASGPTQLRIGARYRVTHGKRSVVVTINDTGGFGPLRRIVDLSERVATILGIKTGPRSGTGPVCMVRVP